MSPPQKTPAESADPLDFPTVVMHAPPMGVDLSATMFDPVHSPIQEARAALATPLPRPVLARKVTTAVLLVAMVIAAAGALVRWRSAYERAPERVSRVAAGTTLADTSSVASTDAPDLRKSPPVPMLHPDGKTMERHAADLVATGAYAEAAAVYTRLAESTGAPIFRDAARIASRKAQSL